MRFVSDAEECFVLTRDLLRSDEPVFLNRIGGSDTNALACLLESRESSASIAQASMARHLPVVQAFNGYYDRANDPNKFTKFLELLMSCYVDSEFLFFCNPQLLSMYFPESINKQFFLDKITGRRGFELLIESVKHAGHNKYCLPYSFVEQMTSHHFSLWNVLSETLTGKKILVISPFSESIESNFPKRHSFFKNYRYPEFTLLTCNTPITYSGLPPEYYPHDDWFETLDSLLEQISGLDFDVALLACGSYGMPIGRHIQQTLGRKAIYVGGVLQLFFGVFGRRYDNIFFLDQINRESFIKPIESQRFLDHIRIDPATPREAFGAYF